MRRTFVVGCHRSGTTVTQAMLARHPDVYSLPETAFFVELFARLKHRWGDHDARARPQRLVHRLGFARHRARDALIGLKQQLGAPLESWPGPIRSVSCARSFIRTLDYVAAQAERSMWLEKTPHHLLYIPEIQQHVPDARFIHVIRPGIDVMASVIDANMRFTGNHAFLGDINLWVQRWNRAMAIHHSYLGKPGHHVIALEDLVRDPQTEWRRLCRFLDLQPHAPMPDACDQPIADLQSEPWKLGAIGGLPSTPERKAESLFGPRLRQWLLEQTGAYDALYARCRQQRLDNPLKAAGNSTVRRAELSLPSCN
ncbi:MAG: sulfotransferase [Dyella sp.]